MKKQKLSLETLKLSSFVTEYEAWKSKAGALKEPTIDYTEPTPNTRCFDCPPATFPEVDMQN